MSRALRACSAVMFSQRMDTEGWGVGLAVRAELAEADLGIEQVVDFGLARQVPDRVRQRHVVHDDERDDGARLGRGGAGGGFGGGRRRWPGLRREQAGRHRWQLSLG